MRTGLRVVTLAIVVLALALPALADFPPLTFVSVRSPVSPGSEGLVTIHTSPNTYCAITVIYKSGPSKAQGLGPQVADTYGKITWAWKIGTRTTPGVWPIVVECGKDQITRIRTTFEVQ